MSGRRLIGSSNMIEVLTNLRTRALRKRIWFQTLTEQERILSGLIRKHVKIVKNATLATVIARIIGKLVYAIKNSFMDTVERIGRPIAESYSRAACAMGWKDAAGWPNDINIVRWYGLTKFLSREYGNAAL